MSSNAILLRLSESDMKMLNELSEKQGLMKSEFLRLLIQTIYIAETTKADKNGNYQIRVGEYGFQLDKEFIEQYAKELEVLLFGIEKKLQNVIISQTKRKKEIRLKRVIKPKKAA